MTLKRLNLVVARKNASLTQAQLGEIVGLTGNDIGNVERCYANTRADVWDKIEDALGVPQRTLREVFEVEEVYHPLTKAG
jgi:Helix-turn-helix.